MYPDFARRFWPLFTAFWLLLFLLGWRYCFAPPLLRAQEYCPAPPDCSRLSVEIIRTSENVSTNCQSSSFDACGDPFRQIVYKVYLRCETAISTTPFPLDYSALDVAVSLKKLNSPIQYSHIDFKATDNCFKSSGNGSKWYNFNDNNGDKVIWTPTEQRVSISFANNSSTSPNCGVTSGNGTSNQIIFTYGAPNDKVDGCGSLNTRCAYVELFSVVVNAYPGEYLVLDCDTRQYVPKSNPTASCAPITLVNTGQHNGTISIGPISNAGSYAGTGNANLLAQLIAPVQNADGGYDFEIQMKNNGTQSITFDYSEFMVKAALFQLTEPFKYPLGSVPREIDGGVDLSNNKIKYLYYIIPSGTTLSAGATYTLSKISIGPPTLSNQGWAATLSFQDSDTKSRLKTNLACTNLNTSGTQNVTISGTSACSDPSILFKMESLPGDCGTTPASMKVGLYSATSASRWIRQISFDLEFDFDPGISISGVDFSNWAAVDCSIMGCAQLNPQACWKVSPDGKTFSYCMATTGALAPEFIMNPFTYMNITFNNTGNGCIKKATLRSLGLIYRDAQSGVPACIPPVDVSTLGLPVCGPKMSGTLATELGAGLEDATVTLSGATCVSCGGLCPNATSTSTNTGSFGFCSICTTCAKFDVKASRTSDPLNGVSTFDLVLINKHILGLEPLNSPYKIIAADANKSNSLTTFDIVELRKLILGNYTSLPNVESWRFIDKTFTFQNPINPFTSLPFPEGINCTTPPQNHLDFVAIKVGDVNNNAVTHSRPAERPVTTLHFGRQASRQSGVLTIPVTYTGDAPLEAIQIGLHFDPAKLALIGPSQGDLPGYTADNFGLTRVAQGEVRTLWLPLSDEMGQLTTGRTLFYLSFRILTDLGESELPIQLDDRVLPNTAWKTDDTEYALSVSPASARDAAPSAETADLQASVRPNPTSGTVVFDLNSRQSGPGRIALFDAFGKLIFMHNLTLQAGQQTIDAPEVAALTAGVYMWKIFAGHQKCSGHLIKQ